MNHDPRMNLVTGTFHKNTTRPVEPFTDKEMQALLNAMKRSQRSKRLARRNVAALVLMWRGGLRLAELLSLTPRDVNLTTGNITVRKGKGGKRRTTRVDGWALIYLRQWSHVIPDNAERFICRRDGKELAPSALREMLKRAGNRAGIPHPVRPHGLRHRFAVELAREGVPLAYISRLLGHENIATTQTYLQTLNIEDALEVISNRPMVAA